MKKLVILVVVSVVIGLGLWYFLQNNDSSNTSRDTSVITSPSLTVTPQLIAKTAEIDSVSLAKPSFLVVREVLNGKLGQMIGVSDYLLFGISENITIKLYSVPEDTADVIVQVFADNGDGRFSDSLDTPELVDGVPYAVAFTDGKRPPAALWGGTASKLIPEERIVRVSYNGTNFSPATITITAGDTVVFTNESTGGMWVASDSHPDHTILSTFDQFGIGKQGEQYQYTFSEVGTWRFHDHVNPLAVGVITVLSAEATSTTATTPVVNADGYYSIDSEAFEKLAANQDIMTINVHTPDAGEIAGTDKKIPFNDTDALLAALPRDITTLIALYCQSGKMSTIAAKELVKAGYTNVYELTGGMIAYQKSGRDIILNTTTNNQ